MLLISEIDATISEKNDCVEESAGFSNTDGFRRSGVWQGVGDFCRPPHNFQETYVVVMKASKVDVQNKYILRCR